MVTVSCHSAHQRLLSHDSNFDATVAITCVCIAAVGVHERDRCPGAGVARYMLRITTENNLNLLTAAP